MRVAVLLLACLSLAACAAPSDPLLPGPPAPSAVRFIAYGDAGTGQEAQLQVAQAMATVCEARGCDLAVSLGDNIYPAGASSATDAQFEEKFETPYAKLSMPFWLILGNHDNGQDHAGTGVAGGFGLFYETGNHQVAYGVRTDRQSDKWHMPDRHYTFTAGPGAEVGFVALDTHTLLFAGVPLASSDVEKVQAQEAWIGGAIEGLRASSWRFALGHHGYISNGPHGDAGAYDGLAGVPGWSGDHTKSFFEESICGEVDVLLFGHDHLLQWLEPVPSCGATHFIGSGGGGADLYDVTGGHGARFAESTHGFWWIEVQGDTMRAAAFDSSGTILFEDELTK